MSDQDNLRDKIAEVIDRALDYWLTVPEAPDGTDEGSEQDFVAQAVIDEFGLTVHGDDCGYHEIHGSYDTRFGK